MRLTVRRIKILDSNAPQFFWEIYFFNNANIVSGETCIFVTAHMPQLEIAICDIKFVTVSLSDNFDIAFCDFKSSKVAICNLKVFHSSL